MNFRTNKKIYIAIIALIVIFLGIIFVESHEWSQGYGQNSNATSTTDENSVATSSDAAIFDVPLFARMYLDGSPLYILTTDPDQDTGTDRSFIFMDGLMKKTINALTIQNYNIEPPEYHLVHGSIHDWLAVTTIDQDGTGYIKYVDTWYALTASGDTVKVLSYTSGGSLDVTNYESELTTSVTVSQNDSAVAIDFVITCTPSPTSYDAPNQCVPMSKSAHYIWDAKKDVFAIDPQNSDITENEIENLYPFPSNP